MTVSPGPVALVAVLCAAGAAWLLASPAAVLPIPAAGGREVDHSRAAGGPGDHGWMRRHRVLLSVLAGCAGYVVVGGPVAVPAGCLVAALCHRVLTRAEPSGHRERRAEVQRSLPHVVALFGSALRGGASPGPALGLVAEALPGPGTDAIRSLAARLALGTDPGEAWRRLAEDPDLASWGRAMARAHDTGAPVVETVERLADELADEARAGIEDRARTVGVRAAVPLGLCLLPAFLLIGIVPLVAGMLGSLW